YGNTGLHIDAHSRGTITAGNGSYDLVKHGVHGIAKETTVNFFGPAYNTQDMADTLYILRDGKQTTVGLENHADDFVGVVFGKNPATFYQRPLGSNVVKEAKKVLSNYPSPHACYSHASKACQSDYGDPNRIYIPSRRNK
ncbi:hypothetical protein, partial [Bartonella sp. MR30HLJHH]|uniref:hypothetical protein n=1 Tax=Bartonella sp. MR30HLJHH TaxID=3243557 RepID=UPI0035D0E748